MRSVAAWLFSFALGCAYGASVAPHATGASVTVVYQFAGPHSEKALQEMKEEVGAILKDSGIQVDWRDRTEVSSSDSFADLVVVKFRGVCKMDPTPSRDEESGPLAFTHTSEGSVLPFSEIECDRVRSSLRGAMTGKAYVWTDAMFGRAIARVVAHELYHVLARTESHAAKGVAQRALSGSELLGDQLELSQDELNNMHR
jgi:hypothetical protein